MRASLLICLEDDNCDNCHPLSCICLLPQPEVVPQREFFHFDALHQLAVNCGDVGLRDQNATERLVVVRVSNVVEDFRERLVIYLLSFGAATIEFFRILETDAGEQLVNGELRTLAGEMYESNKSGSG